MKPLFGIAVFHHIGDVLCSTPIARQLKADYPDCHVTWFTSHAGEVSVRGNPYIDELVVLDGDQYALDEVIPQLSASREWTRFFTPAAYMNYGAVPGGSLRNPRGTIFGLVKAGAGLEWTVPFIFPFRLAEHEKREAREFWSSLPAGIRILVETDYRSEQSPWTDDWNLDLLAELRPLDPVFVFTARERPPFFEAFRSEYRKAFWCHLPFRANAELFNLSDAFIGVSSGLSCLTYSDYCRTDVPRIEVTRGEHWGAAELHHHRNLFLCYSRRKFREALQHLHVLLSGTEPVPEPRSEPTPDQACPSCGDERLAPYFVPALHLCRSCGAVFRRGPALRPRRPVTVDCIGQVVTSSTLDEFLSSPLAPGTADSVVIGGPIETVPDPAYLFQRIQCRLKEHGKLAVSAENRESFRACHEGERWAGLTGAERRWLFSPRTLKETLIQAGFVIDRCDTITPKAAQPDIARMLTELNPQATRELLEPFAREIDRCGSGATIHIDARKRGGYKGRVQPAARHSTTTVRAADVRAGATVAFVIPWCGRAALLEAALRSVIAQTERDWTAVIVPDRVSATDRATADSLVRNLGDPRIRMLTAGAVGPDGARDRGAAEVETPWLVFLDADDTIAPTFLERTLSVAAASSAVVVTTYAVQAGHGSRRLDIPTPDEDSIRDGYPYPTTCLLARTVWRTMGGCFKGLPQGSFSLHLWHAILEHGACVATVPEPLIALTVGDPAQMYHDAHRHWRLRLAMTRLAHPDLYSDADLRKAAALVRRMPEFMVEELRSAAAREPGCESVHLFLALEHEGNRLFGEAEREYDAWCTAAPQRRRALQELFMRDAAAGAAEEPDSKQPHLAAGPALGTGPTGEPAVSMACELLM